jgi:hypothetical protein
VGAVPGVTTALEGAVMLQIAQVVGAILVLIPFAWSQLGRLGTASMLYLALNFLGSGVLAALALHERQWGFLLLEGIWAMVAAWGLGRGSRTCS